MAKLRNITTDTLETRVDGRSYTTEPDGILEVPDDVHAAHLWPETVWSEIEAHHPRKKTADKEN